MNNSFLTAVLSRLFSTVCLTVTAFASLRLYNIYMSKDTYGVVLVGLQVIAYLPLAGGGFRTVLNQQMLADRDPASMRETAHFGQVLQTYLVLAALVCGLLLMAIYSQIPTTRTVGLSLAFFLSIGAAGALTFSTGGQMSLLVGMGEQVQSFWVQTIWGLLGFFILWLCFVTGLGAWAFPVSTGLGALLTLPLIRIYLRRRVPDIQLVPFRQTHDFRRRLKLIWTPAMDCLRNQFGSLVIFSLDLILVGILVGPGAAAVYGIISRILGMSRQVIQSLAEAAWPRLAQEADLGRKALLMRRVDRLNASLVGSWFGAMAATLLPFLGWLMKADWVAGPILLGLLLTRHAIISLTSPHAYGLMSLGRFRELARLAQREALIGAILGVALGLIMGSLGIAIAYLLATLSVSAWELTRHYFKHMENSRWVPETYAIYSRALLGMATSFIFSYLFWSMEHSLFHLPGWTAMFAGGVGFAGTVGITIVPEFARTYWKNKTSSARVS